MKITIGLSLYVLFVVSLSIPYASGFTVTQSKVSSVGGELMQKSSLAETSIAVSSDKRPHIVYYDPGEGILKYATKNCLLTCPWSLEVITSTVGKISFNSHTPSVTNDSKGVPHVAYIDDGRKIVKYTNRENGVWKTPETVFLDAKPKFYSSIIAVDSKNIPHILFMMLGSPTDKGPMLIYATKEGGNWKKEVIHKGTLALSHPSLVLDSKDNPHIVFSELSTDGPKTKYKTKVLGMIPISFVTASGSEVGHPAAHALDGDFGTRWANTLSGSWITADLGGKRNVCSVDIAWYNGNQRKYHFVIATSTDGTTFTNVFSGDSSGTTTNLEKYPIPSTPSTNNARYVKITVNGNTQNNAASIYELRTFGSYDPGPGPCTSWTQTEILPISQARGPSIAVDSKDVPHISYTDTKFYNLNHAKKTANGWQMDVVESFGNNGYQSYIAFDKRHDLSNFVYLSWAVSSSDPLLQDLNFARSSPVSKNYQYLWLEFSKYLSYPDIALTGSHDIAVDSRGNTHISYVLDNKEIKYALIMGTFGY